MLDASGMIVMPGLVDSHRHFWQTGTRADSADHVFWDLVATQWPQIAANYSAEDVYATVLAGAADALSSGVTTVLDWCHVVNTPAHAEEIFQVFEGLDDLNAMTADAGVISATHFKSVTMLAELYQRRQDFLPAYYVQDYEPLFNPKGSARADRALLSYRQLPGVVHFAKTHWLSNLLTAHADISVLKVAPGLDRRVYHARGRSEGDGRIVGAIGVIGPTRINYGRIIPVVDYTARVIGRLLG